MIFLDFKIIIGAVVVVAVIIGVVAVVTSLTPDYDAILMNQDCDAAFSLTAEQLSKAPSDKALALELLQGACIWEGMDINEMADDLAESYLGNNSP